MWWIACLSAKLHPAPLSLPIHNKIERENKIKKLMGQDKDAEISHEIWSWVKQTDFGEKTEWSCWAGVVHLRAGHWDQHCLTSLLAIWMVRLSAPSAHLLTTVGGGWHAGGNGWAYMDLAKFKKVICKVLHVGLCNPSINTGWAENELKAALKRKIWGCWLTRRSTWPGNVHLQPRMPTIFRAASCAACQEIKGNDSVPLVQLWGPQHKKDLNLLEQVQRRASSMKTAWESWLFSLEKRILWGDLIAPSSI